MFIYNRFYKRIFLIYFSQLKKTVVKKVFYKSTIQFLRNSTVTEKFVNQKLCVMQHKKIQNQKKKLLYFFLTDYHIKIIGLTVLR